jgi:four helix bundle protein
MAVKSYRDLIAWQRAMDLVEAVYAITASWPDAERFGLISQVRRAAVSIPSNIAEATVGDRIPNSGIFSELHTAHCANWKHVFYSPSG